MIPQPPPNKTFPPALALTTALLLFVGCAGEPSAPTDDNSAPQVQSITVSGNRPEIYAGWDNLLLVAETSDVDGDALTFTWLGVGVDGDTLTVQSGDFHTQDDATKSVRLDVPAGGYGSIQITCSASDGQAEGSRTTSFEVGRAVSDSDPGDQVGGTITWGASDAPFYILTDNLSIPSGVTLSIEAGTTIYCNAARLLTINGSLVVAGTTSGKVEFKAWLDDTEESGYWDGISFQSAAGHLDLDFCIIRNANVAIDLSQGSGNGADLTSCGFFSSSTALLVRFAEPTVRGCTVDGCSKGFDFDLGSQVSVENCNFRNTVSPTLIIRGGSEGLVSGCFFTDFSPPAISITGGAYVDFHDNSFLGTEIVFNVGAGGYASEPEPLDARCNFWGDGVISVDIAERIERPSEAPQVSYTPWKADSGEECGGGEGPVLTSGIQVTWDARHPLFGDPPGGIDFTVLADDGYPRLLRIDVDGGGEPFFHDYLWSTAGQGSFFYADTDWPDSPPDDVLPYAGQTDGVDGSEIFFIGEVGASGETVTVVVTDNWGLSDSASEDFVY